MTDTANPKIIIRTYNTCRKKIIVHESFKRITATSYIALFVILTIILFITVKCTPGTYNNYTANTCEKCAIGSYQEAYGAMACTSCPINTSTLEDMTKNSTQCIGKTWVFHLTVIQCRYLTFCIWYAKYYMYIQCLFNNNSHNLYACLTQFKQALQIKQNICIKNINEEKCSKFHFIYILIY